MARISEDQLHQIRDERKQQIIQAALKVSSRRGILGTKMSMIAAEAGISHGLFYHYFESKEELFNALVQEAVESSIASIEGLYHLEGSPMEKISLLTKHILDESSAPYFMLIHQARNSDGVPEKAKQLIRQYPMEAYVERLLPLFKEGQQAGDIAEGNLEELISSYIAVLSGVMVLGEGYRIPEASLLMRIITRS